MKNIITKRSSTLLLWWWMATPAASSAFVSPSRNPRSTTSSLAMAAPKRLESNVDGPLYVNEKCINCAACSMFAPASFGLDTNLNKHVVHHQPVSEEEIEEARAALSACPVAAIRTETQAQRSHRNEEALSEEEQDLSKQLAMSKKLNGRDLPFPRRVSDSFQNVYFMGHHNEKSFGAAPYLFSTENGEWILVDTPRFGKPAVEALETITNGQPPSYLILTHVDDTAGHNQWKEHYPNLQRVFHAGDLGRHNWIGDTSLEDVEILLKETSKVNGDDVSIQAFDLQGNPIDSVENEELVILHTPGHSPGSISILFRPKEGDNDVKSTKPNTNGVLFTGDTYAYRLASDKMTGFPRYGNDRVLQSKILQSLINDWGMEWDVIAPGHGHVRDYTSLKTTKEERQRQQTEELQPAVEELQEYAMARW